MYEAQYSDYSPDFSMYESLLDKNIPVIEFGSGTGRISLNLLKKGYTVFGIEKDKAYRDFFSQRLQQKTFKTKFNYIQDIKESQLLCNIIYPFNVLFCLNKTNLHKELNKLRNHPFNSVVFGIDNIHEIDKNNLTVKQHRYKELIFNEKPILEKSRIKIENEIIKDSIVIKKFSYFLYLHKSNLLLNLFNQNFANIQFYGDFSLNKYIFNSEKMVAVIT